MAATINLATSSPDTLVAESFILLLPSLLQEIDANQAPPSFPPNYQHWLGQYGYDLDNVVVTLTESGVANVLNGTLFGVAQSYTWDPTQSAASGFAAAFRAADAGAAAEACHVLYAVSKDAALYFRDGDSDGRPTVT
eukprot:TRINITY_DN2779_c0_g1_i2.p2 TRINITY_DN2779_c0_g1~~TRINITY_DN2779_c0_g1_i2.p2  ORF type:complete len:137 (+),score=47.80 TRINITY_DN2779_c0_g1_i2:459-869(+)